jgi:serine protease DegQ
MIGNEAQPGEPATRGAQASLRRLAGRSGPLRRLWLIFAQAATVAMGMLLAWHAIAPAWWRAAPAQLHAASAPAAAASYREAAALAIPAVVSVTAERLRPPRSGQRAAGSSQRPDALRPGIGLGSGVLVGPPGCVLTNDHVIDGAQHIEVRLADGRSARARLVARDPESDLALLRIAVPGLPHLEFADDRQARVGDVVLAIGYPFGVGSTVTQGVISALDRHHLGINTFEDFIQTDAAINPGNSGGALVDTHGRLLGINSAIYSRSGGSLGIGFAIPASTARKVLHDLVEHGAVLRGWIGVQASDIDARLARRLRLTPQHGLLVDAVVPRGPAARAGLRRGDVLLELAGTPLRDGDELLQQVAAMPAGSEAKLRILRAGRERSVALRVGRRPLPSRVD